MGLIKTVSSKYGQQKAAARNLWVAVVWDGIYVKFLPSFLTTMTADTALNCKWDVTPKNLMIYYLGYGVPSYANNNYQQTIPPFYYDGKLLTEFIKIL